MRVSCPFLLSTWEGADALRAVATSVAFLRSAPDSVMSVEEKARFFRYSAKNLGASALCLSGGASFGYCELSSS